MAKLLSKEWVITVNKSDDAVTEIFRFIGDVKAAKKKLFKMAKNDEKRYKGVIFGINKAEDVLTQEETLIAFTSYEHNKNKFDIVYRADKLVNLRVSQG